MTDIDSNETAYLEQLRGERPIDLQRVRATWDEAHTVNNNDDYGDHHSEFFHLLEAAEAAAALLDRLPTCQHLSSRCTEPATYQVTELRSVLEAIYANVDVTRARLRDSETLVTELRSLLEAVFAGVDVTADAEWVERARVAMSR